MRNARFIAVVYESTYKCGHTRQITLSAHPSQKERKRFARVVKLVASRDCSDACEDKK